MKYRKKPIVVEAFQMTEVAYFRRDGWPQWLHLATIKPREQPGAFYMGRTSPMIFTLEGSMRVEWGDYIIQGVQGELYPCKPDIFEATYEVVGEGMPQANKPAQEPELADSDDVTCFSDHVGGSS